MRVAQLAPLWESVPPRLYGGTERVVHWLTEELIRRGHQVTLYATGDSRTTAELRAIIPSGVRLHGEMIDGDALHLAMLEQVRRQSSDFDIVHSHLESRAYPRLRELHTPHISTIHSRTDLPENEIVYREFCDLPLVAISDAQQAHLPQADWRATIHHGMPKDDYRIGSGEGGYLLFLGRICPEKRPDRAVQIARDSGLKLIIAAKLEPQQQGYFDEVVRPWLSDSIRFVGEVDQVEKQRLLMNAKALLFPIDWPEPFGLVMIESLACGTPIIGWREGSVPEIIDSGTNGIIINSIDEGVEAVRTIERISRSECRRSFETRFSVEVMADKYLALYEELLFENSGVRPSRAEDLKEYEPVLEHIASAGEAVRAVSRNAETL